MDNVTSQEILEKLAIKSAKTLRRWCRRQLIPQPQVGKHPSGRGRVSFWPRWVLDRCVRIRQLLQEGRTLDEIQEMLGGQWPTEPRPGKRRYRFADAQKALAKHLLEVAVRDHVGKGVWMVARKGRELLPPDLVPMDVVDKAVELATEGYNPVVVVSAGTTVAVPDFLVSQRLAAAYDSGEPMLVVPVFSVLSRSLEDFGRDEPAVRPAKKVVEDGDTGKGTKNFDCAAENWEFKLRSRRRPRGKRG